MGILANHPGASFGSNTANNRSCFARASDYCSGSFSNVSLAASGRQLSEVQRPWRAAGVIGTAGGRIADADILHNSAGN
jgi:hypothetical protein